MNYNSKATCNKCGITYKTDDILYCLRCGGKLSFTCITCKNCNERIPNQANFCYKCGATQKEITCKNCAATIDEGSIFCMSCGVKVVYKP